MVAFVAVLLVTGQASGEAYSCTLTLFVAAWTWCPVLSSVRNKARLDKAVREVFISYQSPTRLCIVESFPSHMRWYWQSARPSRWTRPRGPASALFLCHMPSTIEAMWIWLELGSLGKLEAAGAREIRRSLLGGEEVVQKQQQQVQYVPVVEQKKQVQVPAPVAPKSPPPPVAVYKKGKPSI